MTLLFAQIILSNLAHRGINMPTHTVSRVLFYHLHNHQKI